MTTATRIVESPESAPHIEEVRADAIQVDERVQRALIPARVKKLAAELDLDGLGVFTLSHRKDGTYVVLDGQHRLAALLEEGMGEWILTCNVYAGLSLAQEAALFRRLNDTRKITPFEDYQKGLVEGDPECVGIDRIVTKHGLKVAEYGADGTITAVKKLRTLYQPIKEFQVGQLLDETLTIVLGAWGVRYTAVEKSILGGVAYVLKQHPDLDRKQLTGKLSKYQGGPGGLLGKARLLKEIRSASVERLVAQVVITAYNKGRPSGRLPSEL